MAVGSLVTTYLIDRPGVRTDMLTPALAVLPYGIGWGVCVYQAYKTHGKRAAWLLLGFPFAWFYPGVLAIFFIHSMLTNGGV